MSAPASREARSGEGRIASVAGAVILGPAARGDESDGVAGITRAARLLSRLFEEVLLVGDDPPGDAPGRRVAAAAGAAPALRGLVGALEAAGAERVLVVPTDLPRLTPDLLLALVAFPEADAVVPRTSEGAHPDCALFRRAAALPAARGQLARAASSLDGLLAALDTRYLEAGDLSAVDPGGSALTRADTPEARARAASLRAR